MFQSWFSPALRQALIEQMPPWEHAGALPVLGLFAFIDAAGSHIEKEGGKALNLASFRTMVLSNISKKPLEQAISGVVPLGELPELLRESIGAMQENLGILRGNYDFRESCFSCDMRDSVSGYLSSLPEAFRDGALSLLGGYVGSGELGRIRELAGRAAPLRTSFFSASEKVRLIEDFGKDAGFPKIGGGFLFSDSCPPWVLCIPADFVGLYVAPLGLKEGRVATTLARQEGIRELLVGIFRAIDKATSLKILYGNEKGVCRVEKVVLEARVDGLDIEVFPQESGGSGFHPLFLGGLELLGFLSPLCLSLKLGVPKGLLNDIILAEMAPIRNMVGEERVLDFFLALAYSGSASISIPKSKKHSLSYLISGLEKQGLVSVEHKGETLHLSPAGRLKEVSDVVRKLGEKGLIDDR